MSLGTNGAAAAQLEDPNHENEFVAAEQTAAEAEAAGITDANTTAAAAGDPDVVTTTQPAA